MGIHIRVMHTLVVVQGTVVYHRKRLVFDEWVGIVVSVLPNSTSTIVPNGGKAVLEQVFIQVTVHKVVNEGGADGGFLHDTKVPVVVTRDHTRGIDAANAVHHQQLVEHTLVRFVEPVLALTDYASDSTH